VIAGKPLLVHLLTVPFVTPRARATSSTE
jgi:hypothetical protein